MNIVAIIKFVNEVLSEKAFEGSTRFERKMEEKQTSSELINKKIWREKIAKTKRMFRSARQTLSFNEKMKVAFALSERDSQIRIAKKK